MYPTHRRTRGALARALLAASLVAAAVGGAAAEQLPTKAYTVENGLAHNRIKHIMQDSRGFLWFCTADGLSRFDGNVFTNYQADDGLFAPSINDLVEARDGTYWVATNSDGVFRFNPRAAADASRTGVSLFTQVAVGSEPVTNRVNVLLLDADGMLWAGTDGGVFVLDQARAEKGFQPIALGVPQHPDIQVQVWAFVKDRAGTLWIGTKYGLLRRTADGRVLHVAVRPALDDDGVTSLALATDGRLWAAHRSGLFVFDPSAPGLAVRRYSTQDGLDSDHVLAVLQAADGRIWIKTAGAKLTAFDGRSFHTYGMGPRGTDAIGLLMEDREGNLWIGTNAMGVVKITKQGWTTYGEPEGLGPSVTSIFETGAGDLYVGSRAWLISRFHDGGFTTVRPPLPPSVTDVGWRDVNNLIQDHAGDWWIGTRVGLFRFPGSKTFDDLARARPTAVYTRRDGLAGDDVTRVFEDSRGDIWIASWLPAREPVVRWERASGTFHRYSDRDGLRPFTSAVAFSEDAAGNVWVGFREAGLARYRAGRFTLVAPAGVPAGGVNGIYRDPSGRIWAAVSRGLYRVDRPDDDRPTVTRYSRSEGLSAEGSTVVTGDAAGRIYVGTSHGIDRLDPATGQIRKYSTATGLTGGEFKAALRDRTGVLWFCTTAGLSRFVPALDEPSQPPPVTISAMRVAGVTRPISALGDAAVSAPSLRAGQNNVQIDFFGIAFRSGEAIRYQYMLEGSGGDWSAPSPLRSVNYANLAPGSYRFLVRAVGIDGTASSSPAVATFEILPPFWRQWWFLAISLAVVGSAAFVLARVRYRRLRALRESENRFRTLAETASDAIITIDDRSRIVLVNQAAEKIFGYPREELIGAELTTLMPAALRHRHQAGFARYRETGARSMSWEAIELPGLHRDGHEVPLEISFGEFTRNGHRFFTGIARDISERRRAEDALRRSREERLAELERVRKRIATDLHDDVGSSLTRISLLGEVARRHAGKDDVRLLEPLGSIVHLSGELVDSMSDIVWAINPNKDHLSDLSQRMRHFASDVLTARQIEFHFRTPDSEQDIRVGADVRREVFLLFKEAVNNVVRHSGCTQSDLDLRVEPDGLVLVVSDNGRGFDTTQSADGHGLLSMRERTRGLGGVFEVLSTPGQGTLLSFRVPFAGDSPHEYAVTKRAPRA